MFTLSSTFCERPALNRDTVCPCLSLFLYFMSFYSRIITVLISYSYNKYFAFWKTTDKYFDKYCKLAKALLLTEKWLLGLNIHKFKPFPFQIVKFGINHPGYWEHMWAIVYSFFFVLFFFIRCSYIDEPDAFTQMWKLSIMPILILVCASNLWPILPT